MSTYTVAGTTLSISAALPATLDSAGFAALSWVPIGELTDIGSIKGVVSNTTVHSPIGTSLQVSKKASRSLPNADCTVGWDEEDAGQILVEAAANSANAICAFKLVKQDGVIRYFTAQVMQFVENLGTVDNIVMGQFTLLRQTDAISTAPV